MLILEFKAYAKPDHVLLSIKLILGSSQKIENQSPLPISVKLAD